MGGVSRVSCRAPSREIGYIGAVSIVVYHRVTDFVRLSPGDGWVGSCRDGT